MRSLLSLEVVPILKEAFMLGFGLGVMWVQGDAQGGVYGENGYDVPGFYFLHIGGEYIDLSGVYGLFLGGTCGGGNHIAS